MSGCVSTFVTELKYSSGITKENTFRICKSMASKKTNLDPNQIVDTSPHLEGMILIVKQMLKEFEFLKDTHARCKHLKIGLQKLLNLLYQASTLHSPPAVRKYLAHLESLQAEFSVIDNDTSGLYAKATKILKFLRTYVASWKKVMKSGVAQPKLFNTSSEENYKQFYNFDHACIPPYTLFAYPIEDGRDKKADKHGKVNLVMTFFVVASFILCFFVE